MFFADRLILLPVILVFYGLILVLAVWLVMWAIRVAPAGVRPDTPRRILDKRFARGEIDQQEYESRKSALDKR